VRAYVGTIGKEGDAYVMKAANEKYLLDSQKKAKNYKGKDGKNRYVRQDKKFNSRRKNRSVTVNVRGKTWRDASMVKDPICNTEVDEETAEFSNLCTQA